jgi:DNA-binding transcriptional regulator YiaG
MVPNDKNPPSSPKQPRGSQGISPTKYSQPDAAQLLRDLLLRANLSQRAAARELGVDERTMRYWAAGQTTPPRMAFLALERLIDIGPQVTSSPPTE